MLVSAAARLLYIDAFSGDNANISTTRFIQYRGTRSHSAQDRLQVCLGFEPQDPADVIAILLIEFAGV